MALGAGATANLAGLRFPGRRNRLLEKKGRQKVPTCTSSSRVGDWRLGELRPAADIPAGIAGNRGAFTAIAQGDDIPELLREGAAEALGGQLDLPRDVLALRTKGGYDSPAIEQDGARNT